MSWAFVTVTYNSRDYLTAYWKNVMSDHPGVEWVVVDNASQDGSSDLAESYGAQVIRLPDNRGFSFANNAGLAQLESSHVLFVNPDISIPRGTNLEQLASWNDALVAPRLLNIDGTVQDSARGLPYLARKVRNRLGTRIGPHPCYVRSDISVPTRIAWGMGAALGGRADVFRSIGAWSEDFFLYYEDHEIGLRAWEAGVEVLYDPAVEFVHEWQRATTSLDRAAWKFELRSMRTFYRKYPSLLSTRSKLPPALVRVRELQWTSVS